MPAFECGSLARLLDIPFIDCSGRYAVKLSKCHLSALITMGIYAVAIALIGQPAHAACNECGTVTDVKTVKIEGKGSGAGAIAGGLLGGVLGH